MTQVCSYTLGIVTYYVKRFSDGYDNDSPGISISSVLYDYDSPGKSISSVLYTFSIPNYLSYCL